ncbi:MAG: sulfatase [Phycisphaerae bacterium]
MPSAVVLLCAALLSSGCSGSDAPGPGNQQGASATNDPLGDAPEDWQEFLDWAEVQLKQTPPAVPLPINPRLPELKWPTVRLDEMLAEADITCVWQPEMSGSEALLTLGPFRSDRPRPNFHVTGRVDRELGPGTVLVISGLRVQREHVGSISIEIRVPFGRHFDLIWSGGGRIRVPLPDNQNFWPLDIATDGLVDWSGPLERIRLRTDGVGEGVIEIRTLRFLPRQDAFPGPTGVRRVRLDQETRNVIYTHGPATLKFSNVTLPERAKLQVGLGHVLPKRRRQARANAHSDSGQDGSTSLTDFEIIVEHDDRQTPVLNRRLEPGEHWTDVSVGLEAWGGKTVSLVLRTISPNFSSIALWANPVIYKPLDEPPCVVLYLIDALGAKHVDLYGYERSTTPNISALAGEGVWFAHAFSNSPVTVASVPDTQLSMPTERHGVRATSIAAPLELVSLADALRAAGFATALFSTNAHAGPRQAMDQGFDHFIYRLGAGWKGFPDRTVPLADLRNWLEVHRDRPKFLYVHTTEPHAPYVPPKDFAGRFDPDYTGWVDGTMDPRGQPQGFDEAHRERDIAHVTALYDEEVLYADARFGLFLDLLSDLRLRERADIFLIADHGEELMEHGHWGHGPSLHTEVLHVPFIVAGPSVTARGKVEVPVQLHDVMPTILALFGLPEPYELEGKSLLPFLQAEAPPEMDGFRRRLIFHSHHRYAGLGIVQYAVIEAARWKLMYFYEEEPADPGEKHTRFALYDLQDFFYDKADVIDQHRDVARRLIGGLLAYRQRQHPYAPGLKAEVLKIDAEQIRELQALGYVGADEDQEDEND